MGNERTVVDLFYDQVLKTPDNTAVVFENIKLSYKELNDVSNQLTSLLIEKGVKEETLVPICLTRPLDTVISILAILKAGAAYVPIDSDFPAERISFMLNDTSSELVITDDKAQVFLQCAQQRTVILLDTEWSVLKDGSKANTQNSPKANHLAYVIYTSGSTGLPKGVLIEHKSLSDYLSGLSKRLPIDECHTFALGVSFAADSVVTNLYCALTTGGELHLFQKDNYNSATFIHHYFENNHIDFLKIVPSHWKSLGLDGKELLPHKILMFGGEALNAEMLRSVPSKDHRNCILINHYGPTETTVGQLLHIINEDLNYKHNIPIGLPFTDARIYILNPDLSETASGEEGELYIGGTCVARGYLNRPELTQERFIVNPFKDNAHLRLYKTGDLVRQLPNGEVEFLGRLDDQVKIRGYRIEIGEIENTLQKAPGVKQSVVMAQDGPDGDKRLVGYIVAHENYVKEEVLKYLKEKLPAYMVPHLLVPLEVLPFFPNGKIDKKSLPNPDASTLLANLYIEPNLETERLLADLWKEILYVSKVGIEDNFFELGGNSLLAQKTVAALRSKHQITLPVTKIYQYPVIRDLAAYIDGRTVVHRAIKKIIKTEHVDVAVIGMAGRFPGADSISEFWDNLKNGKETTSFFKDSELDESISRDLLNDPNYVKARGIIEGSKEFDPAFFGITSKHAELMDPQQRIFLEIAWEALEKAGYSNNNGNQTVGVFAGVRSNTYFSHNVLSNKELIDNIGEFQLITLNDKDYVATRTAYALNLKGPAVNVQSACSTSLLAVAQAVQSIRNGHCEMALAGGATINAPIRVGHLYEAGAILSADGHCRPFDSNATGTVFSDGAGVVLLKNKDQAILDGDPILAVIKGIGLSNDGAGKSSFTAPSAEGQSAAIRMAIEDANIDPANISYVEAHGTATPIGDPIEFEGLNMAFGKQDKKQYCAIGSVKSNFGHLTTASGVVGFIKTVLSLYHKQIVPSINYAKPNPNINFGNSPFYVNTELKDWTSTHERIAGVSSFGVGGTNVHVLLTEGNKQQAISGDSRPLKLISWSAKNEKSVDAYGKALSNYLINEHVNLADVAYTLHNYRQDFQHRRFAVVGDTSEFATQIQSNTIPSTSKNLRANQNKLVFMFPGQGAQYIDMGKALYANEPVFKDAMNECAAILETYLGENILEVIYPPENDVNAQDKLKNTKYSQPAIFSIGYALTKLYLNWGIYPSAVMGHSIGEFVAAYFAGVFSLKDALKIISERGKLMSELEGGSMLSVRASSANIQQFLSDKISLAAENSPMLCVIAGTKENTAALSFSLTELGILNKPLQTSHAFHSYMMDPVIKPFEDIVNGIQLNEPIIPLASTVTGKWLTKEEATNPQYWSKHLRATVVFGKAVQTLLDDEYNSFLELGPGNSTATLVRQQAGNTPIYSISTLEQPAGSQSSYYSALKALGQLWVSGIEIDWKAYYKNENRIKLVDLPTYAFDKKEYWVLPKTPMASSSGLQSHIINPVSLEENKTIKLMRKPLLIDQIKEILENASGIEMADASPDASFIEIGLDSLLLTQVSLILRKTFSLPITFRQLNEDYGTLNSLADYLDANLPATHTETPQSQVLNSQPVPAYPTYQNNNDYTAIQLISQQIQLLAKQVDLIQGSQATQTATKPIGINNAPFETNTNRKPLSDNLQDLTPEEAVEIKKPFGAAARIERQAAQLNPEQLVYLQALTERYNALTSKSKAYAQKHRSKMADPRVVSGFKPATKELLYPIVIKKSKGARLWDIDDREYIDSLNGFGSNMLGYQPDFLKNALINQIEKGYEIGPQHELAGEVSELICEFTNFDRVGLCNTGSEAVLGAIRIARTVTGKSTIVAFTGSYHGIIDEVIVRGSKKLKSYPASPGIMPEAVENILILDYGTEESLKIIEERADDIAAVLVEPIQSRRADFQPIDFLRKLRKLTEERETILIFDEVISGFRFHPGGIQAMFGIQADIGTYGKVAGGGLSIGIVAGKKRYMDALDGGFWQYGDQSIPEVGVTYFAGTFVRHPLALATAKATLEYLKEMGPTLQEKLNANGNYIANSINQICRRLEVPMFIAQFGSLWRIKMLEEYPFSELFFVLMRLKGIHILEGFPCFLTTAHTQEDIEQIVNAFEESLIELKDAGFIPEYKHPKTEIDINLPPVPNARLGKDKDGNPGWFIQDEKNPGKYFQVN